MKQYKSKGCQVYPALQNVQEIPKLPAHIKFLSGDYLTAERLAIDNGKSPQCRLCLAPVENISHVLTKCRATSQIHSRMLPELLNTVLYIDPNSSILQVPSHDQYLTQFILDCTSLNLPATYRISAHNPLVGEIYRISRDWCYGISKARARLLCQLDNRT